MELVMDASHVGTRVKKEYRSIWSKSRKTRPSTRTLTSYRNGRRWRIDNVRFSRHLREVFKHLVVLENPYKCRQPYQTSHASFSCWYKEVEIFWVHLHHVRQVF